jgi:hypothetical protein
MAGPQSPDSIVAAALDATAAAGTARLRSTPAADGAVVTWDGVVDLAARVAWLRGEVPAPDIPNPSALDEPTAELRAAVGDTTASGLRSVLDGIAAVREGGAPPTYAIRSGGRCYVHVGDGRWTPRPDGVWEPPSGGSWRAAPHLDGPREDPIWLLDVMPAVRDSELVGKDLVGGERMARYRVTIDALEADRLAAVPLRVAEVEDRSLAADLCVDADGRIRRLAGPARLTELYAFGVEVEVVAPPGL